MASFEEHFSGLARDIRSSTTSEQFDLAGYSENRTKELVQSAFGTPMKDLTSMVRFTFIVGGGKLVRSRYDDDLIRWMASALREIGYVEDKSAAETFDSQGTFKSQHDIGQNLKYVIVYPRVDRENLTSARNEVAPLDSSSPSYVIIACESSTFHEIVSSKVTSWRQKKNLLKVLQEYHEKFAAIETKLISGSQLSEDEQQLYDINPGNDAEKILWLQNEIKLMVDNGKLTPSEKKDLLSSIDANIHSVGEEIAKLISDTTNPELAKLDKKKQALLARKAIIDKVVPIQHRLLRGPEIQSLRMKLVPLHVLEEKGRTMSLTLADLKLLEEKSDLESRISELEEASREWFEDDADFKVKCDAEAKEAKLKASRMVKPTSSASKPTVQKSVTGGWASVGMGKKSTTSASSQGKGGVKKSGFAAAFGDDSD